MLINNIGTDDIMIGIAADGWEDAIEKSAKTLLDKGSIKPEYVTAMIQAVKDNGPYIVISKHIALAHARPECGVINMGLSFATLKPPIEFGAGALDPVKIIITLAATDHDTHIDIMSELAEILMDGERVSAMAESKSSEELLKILKG